MVFGNPWSNTYNGKPIGPPQVINNGTYSSKIPRAAWILGGTAVAMGAWPVVLGAAGWTAAGVGAGTFAAGLQAGIGNVAAGSAFALAQSAAMGGATAGVVNGVVGASGFVGAAFVYGQDSNKVKSDEKCQEEKEKDGD